ncbi:hypothetical protein HDU67_005138 [Dinochytrium kinnereticum]|nr:hypothetical protein HDU67_005138 [Dinochytrium kinnereticum]
MEAFVGMFAGFIMGISANLKEAYVGTLISPYVLGSSSGNDWFLGFFGMLIGIAIALSCGPSGVKVFGEEKPIYWRETASGHNTLSYYIGKTISVLYGLTLSALHFTSTFYFLGKTPIPIGLQFSLIFLNFFFIYGLAAVISMIVRRENAALVTVIVGLFIGVFCGFGLRLDAAAKAGYIFVFNMGGNRWAAEAQFWLWIKYYEGIYDLTEALKFCGYAPDRIVPNLVAIFCLGIGYRVVGYFLLIGLNRQKQK